MTKPERARWWIRLAVGISTAVLVELATHVVERWGIALGMLALFATSFAVTLVLSTAMNRQGP
jgi:hypothetical protein